MYNISISINRYLHVMTGQAQRALIKQQMSVRKPALVESVCRSVSWWSTSEQQQEPHLPVWVKRSRRDGGADRLPWVMRGNLSTRIQLSAHTPPTSNLFLHTFFSSKGAKGFLKCRLSKWINDTYMHIELGANVAQSYLAKRFCECVCLPKSGSFF